MPAPSPPTSEYHPEPPPSLHDILHDLPEILQRRPFQMMTVKNAKSILGIFSSTSESCVSNLPVLTSTFETSSS
jgi:hypothetical protein